MPNVMDWLTNLRSRKHTRKPIDDEWRASDMVSHGDRLAQQWLTGDAQGRWPPHEPQPRGGKMMTSKRACATIVTSGTVLSDDSIDRGARADQIVSSRGIIFCLRTRLTASCASCYPQVGLVSDEQRSKAILSRSGLAQHAHRLSQHARLTHDSAVFHRDGLPQRNMRLVAVADAFDHKSQVICPGLNPIAAHEHVEMSLIVAQLIQIALEYRPVTGNPEFEK